MFSSSFNILRTRLVIFIAFLALANIVHSQGIFNTDINPINIPVELKETDLRPGSKKIISMSMPVACTGGGNQSIGGFMQCATQADASVGIDRNDWWNCCAPPNWLPSEAYGYNFPSIESVYPCVAGAPVDELILTITINSVSFDLSSPYACCETYLEGLFANLYDDCPVSNPCGVVGDGLANNGNPGTGDCAPSGDNLNYDGTSSSFPLGIPFTSTTTCLNTIIGTGDELGVDIVPSFRYDEASANGCNCTQDLISQGFISVDYSIEVEYVFCSNNLPNGCYPSTFTQIDPLCETDPALTLPTTSDNGYSGTWSPPTIDPSGQGGNTITAIFTPDAGQCVGGTSEMEIMINEAGIPTFSQLGPLCENDPPIALPTTSINGINGTWDVGSNFDPSGEGGNTVTILFTPNAGQCAATQTMDIVVNDLTVPAFTQIGPLCESDSPVALPSNSNNGISGSWDVGGSFDPAGQGGNNVVINFTPDAGQCASPQSMTISVTTEVLPTFTSIGPLCEDDAPVTLPTSSNNGVNGTWDVGPTFDPAGNGGMTVTINFTPDPGECAVPQTLDIVVNTLTSPTFDPIGPICETDPPIALPTTSNNGITGNWDVGSSFDPAGQGGMTVTINFTPDAGQCADVQSIDIVVNNLTLPTFDPVGPLCETDPPIALPTTSNNGITGNWDVGSSFDPAGQGGMTVTINFTPDAGQCADVQTIDIVVDSEALPTFTEVGPLCESDPPVTLPTTSNNGITGTWNVGPTFDPQGLGGTVSTINFTPAIGECATSEVMNITVLNEDAPIFMAIAPLCENEPPIPLPSTSLNGYTGSWDVGTTFDPSGAGGNVVTINFTPDPGQCVTTASIDITVLEEIVPQFNPIGPLCESDSPVNLPTTSLNGVTGNWDIGNVFDPNGQNGTNLITFIPDPGQCSAQGSLTIIVVLDVEPTFDPIGPFCEEDDPFVLPTTSIEGISGTWNIGTEFDPMGLSGMVEIIFSPDPNQCASQDTVNVQVNDLPTSNIVEVSCNAGLVDYYIELQTDANDVTSSIGTVTNNGSGSFTIDGIPEGTDATLTLTNTSSGCQTIIEVTSPNCNCPTIDPPTGSDVEICEGTTIPALTVSVGAGLQVDWYNAGTGGLLLLSNSVSYTPTLPGIYYAESVDPNSGCTSNIRLGVELIIIPIDTTFESVTTCDTNLVGMDTVTYNTAVCDSIVITTYTLEPGSETFLNETSCDPNAVGLDTLYLTNIEGCDSLIITNTVLSQSDTTLVSANSCDPNEIGIDTLVLTNIEGCDSLIITSTVLSQSDTTLISASSCDPNLVGVDTVIFSTPTCDSIVITTTSLLEGDEIILFENTCDSTQVGLDTLIFSNQNGCDSLVITEFTFVSIPVTFIQETTCNIFEVGQDTTIYSTGSCDSMVITATSLLMGDETFLSETTCDPNEMGVDTLILSNVQGCDSLIITSTTLIVADTTFLQTSTCDINAVGVDTLVYQTANCDSIVILTSILMDGDETLLNATTCNPNEVGLDTVSLVNQMGCDSLIITSTQLSLLDTTFTTATTCDINEIGLDTLIFSSSGCDSIVIVDFIFVPPSETLINETSCDLNQIGVDTTYYTNAGGCDSLVITSTTLISINPTLIELYSCNPSDAGIDTTIFNISNCDSLVITTTLLVDGNETIINQFSCIHSEIGQDTAYLLNQFGCDSLVITNTSLQGGINSALINIDQPDCIDQFGSIEVETVSGGTSPFLYSIDGGTNYSTEPNFDNLPPGAYEVLIEDANGCNYVSIEMLENLVEPQVFFNPDEIELLLGESSFLQPVFTVPDSQIVDFQWTPEENLSCLDCSSPIATPVVTTEYTITVIDENGCQASASVLLVVNDKARLYAPNAISPNGDGINDSFTLFSGEDYIESIVSLKIFDRWGNNVYENFDFTPNSPQLGWDGTKNGKIVEQGVHVYVAEIKLANGQNIIAKGEITVIR